MRDGRVTNEFFGHSGLSDCFAKETTIRGGNNMATTIVELFSSALPQINHLAISLYRAHGLQIDGARNLMFDTSILGRRCWAAAVVAYYNSVYELDGIESNEGDCLRLAKEVTRRDILLHLKLGLQ